MLISVKCICALRQAPSPKLDAAYQEKYVPGRGHRLGVGVGCLIVDDVVVHSNFAYFLWLLFLAKCL